jgi:hypothetical protein
MQGLCHCKECWTWGEYCFQNSDQLGNSVTFISECFMGSKSMHVQKNKEDAEMLNPLH